MVGSSSDCRLNSRNVSDRAGACPSGVQLAIVGQAVAGDAVLTAKNNGTLTELKVRPVSAVTLGAAIPPATSALFGAKPNAPFDTMRTLFGWPERPGLYRDLLRTRRLGLSTACLRDVDGDGRFDEGRRFDFNSGFGDLLGITPSGKIIGVRTTAKRLPVLCRSRSPTLSATSPGEVTGRLALMWRKGQPPRNRGRANLAEDARQLHGHQGLSEQVAQFPLTRVPLDVELYGIKLRVLGFDEKGAMRYQVIEVRDGATVPLRFRGYTFRIMII